MGYRLDGKTIDYFPNNIAVLDRCQSIYEEMPGWQTATTHIRKYEQLPPLARQYLTRLGELTGCPINLICVGPERQQTILAKPIL